MLYRVRVARFIDVARRACRGREGRRIWVCVGACAGGVGGILTGPVGVPLAPPCRCPVRVRL